MATDDINIHHAAKVMVDRDGEDGPLEAAIRAGKLLDGSAMEGREVWV